MADFKISQLDAMSSGDITRDDVIIINEGDSTTKKTTLTALFASDEVKDLIAGGDGTGDGNVGDLIPDPDGSDNQPGTLDDRYVNIVGDNMTGALTIGPDGGPAVTTLADDGSATFTGTIQTGNTPYQGGGNGAQLQQYGSLLLSGPSTQDAIQVYETNTTDIKASIKSDGTATFAGGLTNLRNDGWAFFDRAVTTHAQVPGNTDNFAFNIYRENNNYLRFSHGRSDLNPAPVVGLDFWLTRTDNSSGPVLRIRQGTHELQLGNTLGIDGTGTPKITLSQNGSSTFAGDISIGGTLPDDPNITLNADGNGTFTGNVFARNLIAQGIDGGGALANKVVIEGTESSNTYGQITIFGSGAAGPTDGVFRVYRRDSAKHAVQIYQDGSATFAGTVLVGNDSTDKAAFLAGVNNASASVDAGGYKVITNKFSGATTYFFSGEDSDGIEKFRVSADGSATFAGDVTTRTLIADVSDDPSKSFGGIFKTNSANAGDTTVYIQNKNDNGKLLSGNNSTEEVVTISADGSAKFTRGGTAFTEINANSTANLMITEGAFISKQTVGTYPTFQSQLNSTTNCEIFADGSATFNGTVKVAGGAVQPLIIGDSNGDDIDVRERLETKTAALEAIKAAAEDASITTLTDFKAAIAAALVNI